MSMKALAIFLSLLASSCGYHLAGQGRGAVPDDVHSIAVIAVGEEARQLLPAMQRLVRDREEEFTLAEADESDAQLHLESVNESFNPIAFNVSGVAVTYRLTLSGNLSLWQKGAKIWDSGTISTDGDVFVVGDPASTEALRQRLKQDLQKQWVRDAWRALSSGF